MAKSILWERARGGCVILECDCKHAFQDETYGRNNRVYNTRVRNGQFAGYRCTVCCKERTDGVAAIKKEKAA